MPLKPNINLNNKFHFQIPCLRIVFLLETHLRVSLGVESEALSKEETNYKIRAPFRCLKAKNRYSSQLLYSSILLLRLEISWEVLREGIIRMEFTSIHHSTREMIWRTQLMYPRLVIWQDAIVNIKVVDCASHRNMIGLMLHIFLKMGLSQMNSKI